MSEAEDIARALNGRRAGHGWLAFCPAHENRRTPALSISVGHGGRTLMKCHAGCTFSDIRGALVARGIVDGAGDWSPPDPEEAARQAAAEAAQRQKRSRLALEIWKRARGGACSPVERYLIEARGIPLRRVPEALRFHPAVPHPTGGGLALPAMVARVDGSDGAPVGVHRTFLAPDGSAKAGVTPDKAALGPIAGGAVRLAPAGETLVVGEGIESTLSFAAVMRLPAWAALSTSGLRSLVLPDLPLAATLVIAADHDAPGQGAAAELAERAAAEGRTVRIACPPDPDADFNDLLRKGAPA